MTSSIRSKKKYSEHKIGRNYSFERVSNLVLIKTSDCFHDFSGAVIQNIECCINSVQINVSNRPGLKKNIGNLFGEQNP